MRRLLIITTLAAGLAMPAASAVADEATFKVSLYGVQRFEESTELFEDDPNGCFDERGTRTSRSEVRFTTRRPVLARVLVEDGRVRVVWRKQDPEFTIPVRAAFKHGGDEDIEWQKPCFEYEPKPKPPPGDCEETLDKGFELLIRPTRIEAVGQDSMVPPIEPFKGCMYGDLSAGLYSAKKRFSIRELLGQAETQVVLRWKDRGGHESKAEKIAWSKRTTVYVTFKEVR